MAIGTTAAIIGGSVLAAGGSALAASSNRSAANRAAQVSSDNNAANVALQREIYNQNRGIMQPFLQRGNAAGNQINALLGLGGSQHMGGPERVQLPMPSGQPNALAQFLPSQGGSGFNPAAFADMNPVTSGNYRDPGLPYGLGDGFVTTGTVTNGVATADPMTGLQTPTQTGQTAQQAAEDAFDIFRNSTGYQFRVNEGMDALNSGFAGSGLLQSGAALRSLDDYRQGMASAEFGNYLGQLGNQQAIGFGGASALAGVGQNFANNVTMMNTQNANNQANAAIARAQNNPFANVAGTVGGGLMGYGMLGMLGQ